jgi:hypothetical protein
MTEECHSTFNIQHLTFPSSLMNDQTSRVQPGLEIAESLIHFPQRISSGQQLVELQLSVAIERKQPQRVAVNIGAGERGMLSVKC